MHIIGAAETHEPFDARRLVNRGAELIITLNRQVLDEEHAILRAGLFVDFATVASPFLPVDQGGKLWQNGQEVRRQLADAGVRM